MLKAKMSKKGKCLPLFPSRRSEGKSQTTPVITGLSAVFHMPLPTGTPLAFTTVCEVQYTSCYKP